MASGFGLRGYEGRCFQFWRDFQGCMHDHPADMKTKCKDQVDDYFECLHHRKEIQRRNAVIVHAHEKMAAAAAGGHPGH